VLRDPRRDDGKKSLRAEIDQHHHNTAAIYHACYRSNFNTVDLHNRYFSLIKIATINAFVIFNEVEAATLNSYVLSVVQWLLTGDYARN